MLKVADFAKIPFSQSFEAENIEEEAVEEKIIVNAEASPPASKNVKVGIRRTRTKNQRSPRKSQITLNGKYHKISDFFSIAKKECKLFTQF